MSEIIKPSYIAKKLNVTTVTVRNWIKTGKLKGYRTPGGHYLILKNSFEKLLKDMEG